MAQPSDPEMYNTLSRTARAKYPSYRTKGLSYQAAKWLSAEYARSGGGYVDSIKQVDPRKRDYKQEALDKEKRKKQDHKREMKKRNLVV